MGADGNKAPCLDGFTFKFAQRFWTDLKGKLLSMFNHFFQMAEFYQRFSSPFIFVIPKGGSPSSLNDFRLISLLSWVYKLVTRVLAAILKGVIDKLVWDTQSAFMIGRNIFKGWTMASDMLDEMKRIGE